MIDNRWIFFDLGWTLVDETEAHLARLRRLRAIAPQYADVSDERFLQLCEHHASQFASSPFQEALRSLDPEDWTSASQLVSYEHSSEHLFSAVPALLGRLSTTHQLGILANQSAGTARRLQEFGIADFFSLIVPSTEIGLAKPDPRFFAHAQALAKSSPERITMVGDRLDNDIAPAKALGWNTVRVLQGFSRHQRPRDRREVPDLTINSVIDLTPTLD
jgi:HAD superfamily hydrolase (TIGR01549 family)